MFDFYSVEQMARQRTALIEQRAEVTARLFEAGGVPGPTVRERLGLALIALGRRIDPAAALPCDPVTVTAGAS